ncbi:MAG: hypothetical protein IT258_23855 [Saprospiraceae bacterium]|nr:hypothetical protein [Saprospiraceae bacterium]
MSNQNDEQARFDAAVQAEVKRQVGELQQQFAQAMEQSMKAGLQGVDAANAALKKQQKAVEKELDAAQKAVKKAEKEGDKIAEDYFQKSRAALIEFTRKDLLRNLIWKHLKAGRAVEDICAWLEVEKEFVEQIIELMDRRVDYFRSEAQKQVIKLEGNPQLIYKDQGRGGTIVFKNDHTSFDMWWEFAGGDALAIIDIPNDMRWETRTKLPKEQRMEILQFIGQQVVVDQTSGRGSFVIGDDVLTIYK